MPSNQQKKLTIRFDAKGDEKLIGAINKLALAQKKLGNNMKKTNNTSNKFNKKQKLITQRVERNVVAFGRLQSAVSIYRNKLLLASFAVTLATTAFVTFVKKAGEQEDSVLKLADVFGNKAAVELNKYSSELQRNSVFGDENINVVMAQIGAFGASAEQTKQLTKATMNLASGLRLDLNTAGLLVAKTIGSTTDALTRYGVGAGGAIEKSEKVANVVESINLKFGGLAKKMSMTTSGQLAQASNAFGDFGEELGRVFAPMVLASAEALRFLAEHLDAETIKRWSATMLTAYGIVKIWNAQLIISRNLSFLVVGAQNLMTTTQIAYTSATVACSTAQKAWAAATVLSTKAIKAMTLAIKRNPIGLIAALLGVAALAAANFFGVFKDGTEILDENEEALKEQLQAEAEILKKQEDSIKSLGDKLKIQKASNIFEQYAAQQKRNFIDLSEEEIRLLSELNAKDEFGLTTKGRLLSIESRLRKARMATAKGRVADAKLDVVVQKKRKTALEQDIENFRANIIEHNLGVKSKIELAKEEHETMKGMVAFNAKLLKSENLKSFIMKELSVLQKEHIENLEDLESQYKKLDGSVFLDNLSKSLIEAGFGLEKVEAVLKRVEKQMRWEKYVGFFNNFKSSLSDLDIQFQAGFNTDPLMHSFDEFTGVLDNTMTQMVSDLEEFEEIQVDTMVDMMAQITSTYIQATIKMHEANMGLIKQRVNAEIDAEKKTWKFKMASTKGQEAIIDEVKKKHKADLLEEFKQKKEMQRTGAVMNTAAAVTRAFSDLPPWAAWAMAAAYIAMGSKQLSIIDKQQPPTFAKGGLILGKSHLQGGTLIEAEKGEFILRKEAVKRLGAETLSNLNNLGNEGLRNNNEIINRTFEENITNNSSSSNVVNISFEGNVLSQDFIEDEAIPLIKSAVRRGADIGIG